MALIHADRTKQESTTVGTGAYALTADVVGFQSFIDGVGNSNQCFYFAVGADGEWESGLGTVASGSPPTLARTTVHASSNGGAAVNWLAGTKTITCGWTARAARPTIEWAADVSSIATGSTQQALAANSLRIAWEIECPVTNADVLYYGLSVAAVVGTGLPISPGQRIGRFAPLAAADLGAINVISQTVGVAWTVRQKVIS